MSAALERGGRALALPVAKAFASEKLRSSIVAEALAEAHAFATVLADALSHPTAQGLIDTVAKAVTHPETFSDTQTFAIIEA